MSITSAVVLYAVLWFLTVFILLPIGLRTQADEGEIVPGTHAGAPANFQARRLAIRATWVSALAWLVITGVILSGWISVRDFDIRHVMG